MEWSFKSSSDEALKRGTPKSRMSPLFSLLRKDFYCSALLAGDFPDSNFWGLQLLLTKNTPKNSDSPLKSDSWKTNSFPFEMLPFLEDFGSFSPGGVEIEPHKNPVKLFVPPKIEYLTKKYMVRWNPCLSFKEKHVQVENPNRCFCANKTAPKKLHRISFSPGWNQSWRSQIQTFTYDLPGKTIRSEKPGRCGVSIVWFPNKNIELRL